MKKCRSIFMALCAVLLVACSASKPSDTVSLYLEYLKDGKCEEAAKLMKVSDNATEEETMALCQKLNAIVESEGGIDKYEILSEEIAEDGLTAVVKVKITYKDAKHDDGEPDVWNLVKIDKKWYIDATVK